MEHHYYNIAASGSDDRTVKIWNLETQTYMTFKGHTSWVNCVSFSPHCSRLLQSVSSNEAKSWSLGPIVKIK